MINGPIERDLWKNLSRLEIRDNRATGRSIMINYITTFEALDYMRGWQRELIEMEDKARSRMLHRVNSGDSGVGLSDDD